MSLPARSATMIGRDADLAVLRQVFAEVEAGEPRGVVLGGEAGIGKTRLIEEFTELVRPSALVISGQCVDLGQVAAPYAPITSLLRGLVAKVGAPAVLEAAGPGRDSLSALLPSLGEDGAAPPANLQTALQEGGVGRLHETIAVLLETFSRDRPVVAIVEDLQWADGATLKLLTFLVRVLSSDRVMLLLSYRSDDVHRGHPVRGFLTELERTRRVLRHEVGRLNRAQVRRQAKAILGRAPNETAIESVFARSEGVPFFVEELLGLDETCEGGDLPDTLRELLLARYERLGLETQRVLRLISAGGVRVDHALVETVFLHAHLSPASTSLASTSLASTGLASTGLASANLVLGNPASASLASLHQASLHEAFLSPPSTIPASTRPDPADLDAAVREAVSANVIVADEHSYAFRHALVREAIHADLLPGENIRFHAAFAEALERSTTDLPVAAEISHHWMSARDLVRAFPATVTAMREAHHAYAYGTEAQLGERLVELWDRVPDAERLAGKTKMELKLSVVAALRNAGDSERAIAMADCALDERDECTPEVKARLLRDKATSLSNLGRPGAVALLEEALLLVPAGSSGSSGADGAGSSGPGASDAGSSGPASSSPGSSSLRAGLLNALGARHMILGDLDRAIALTDEAANEAREKRSARNASVAANLGGISRIQRGDLEEGLALVGTAKALAEGDGSALLRYWVNASDMANLLGRYEESLALATEGVKRAKALGVERSSGVILSSNAVDPLMALGRWDEADETLDRAMTLAPPLAFSVYLRQSKILSTLWRGDVDGAAALYRGWRSSMLRLAEQEMQTRFGVARVAIEIALATGDLDEAWAGVWALTAPDHRVMPAYDLPLLGIAARVLARVRERIAGAGFPASGTLSGITAAELDAVEASWRVLLDAGAFWPTAPLWSSLFDAELGGPARCGDDPEAWRSAVAGVAVAEAPALLLPYAEYRLGKAALAHGDRAAAQESIRSAIDRAAGLGAHLVVAQAMEVAARGGLVLEGAVRERRTHDSNELTSREQQVLRLIAEGCTNRQIGERLFISTKTASVHVSAILRKLGVASRTEAAVLVRPPLHEPANGRERTVAGVLK